MRKTVLILLIPALFLSCNRKPGSQNKSTNHTITDSLTHDLVEIHKQGQINGFGVAIVNQDGPLYRAGIGYSNVATGDTYTENTIQNIGSVSKTLIGIALLKAQELGKLKLDDPVNAYLPFQVNNPNHTQDPITIRHLATHTSSIRDTDFYEGKSYILKDQNQVIHDSLGDLGESFRSADNKIPLLEFLRNVLTPDGPWYLDEGFLKTKPGEVYEYTNIGATLAAAVLEIAVGQSFDAFTREHILNPLEMQASGWSFSNIDQELHSKLYFSPELGLPMYTLITYPDGGLLTNISDLSQYLTELIRGYSGSGTLLSNASYKELFAEQLTAENFLERDLDNPYDDEYNSGIFMGFTPGGFVGHTGGDPGIATFMFFNPESGIGRILMINTSIRNQEGVDEFYAIWNTLEESESKFNR